LETLDFQNFLVDPAYQNKQDCTLILKIPRSALLFFVFSGRPFPRTLQCCLLTIL
jgi:hypothetical protein